MSSSLIPAPQQFFDNNGNPLSFGKVYTYIAGTSTPKTTWSLRNKTVSNSNPVVLDAAVLGAPSSLGANTFFTLRYRSATATWYQKG